MSFLTAEWKKLAFANYKVSPSLLQPYVPVGTELDFWKGDCYISLIGFMFQKVKLLKLSIPFHMNFEEVNLRFYVKRKTSEGWRRGVVFIKELVPLKALSWVANTVYNEHYETVPMKHTWVFDQDHQSITYRWKQQANWQTFCIKAALDAKPLENESKEEFITEHYFGYSKISASKTNEYQVHHPRWKHYKVIDADVNVDFVANYGPAFSFLNNEQPNSLILAEGSEVSVDQKRTLILNTLQESPIH